MANFLMVTAAALDDATSVGLKHKLITKSVYTSALVTTKQLNKTRDEVCNTKVRVQSNVIRLHTYNCVTIGEAALHVRKAVALRKSETDLDEGDDGHQCKYAFRPKEFDSNNGDHRTHVCVVVTVVEVNFTRFLMSSNVFPSGRQACPEGAGEHQGLCEECHVMPFRAFSCSEVRDCQNVSGFCRCGCTSRRRVQTIAILKFV